MSDTQAQLVQLIEVRFKRGDGTDDDPVREVVAYRQLDGEMVAELDPRAEGILVAPPRRAGTMLEMRVGQDRIITFRVRARVTDTLDTEHGISYELELERRMFNDGRTIAVDAEEIIDVEMVAK